MLRQTYAFVPLMLVAALCSAFSGEPLRLTQNAHIRCDSVTYEAGRMEAGSPLHHKFILTNIGSETLRIYQAAPSCGCTVAKLLDSTVAPGASTALEVSIKTDGYNGPITKNVTIHSNSEVDSMLVLQVKATLYLQSPKKTD